MKELKGKISKVDPVGVMEESEEFTFPLVVDNSYLITLENGTTVWGESMKKYRYLLEINGYKYWVHKDGKIEKIGDDYNPPIDAEILNQLDRWNYFFNEGDEVKFDPIMFELSTAEQFHFQLMNGGDEILLSKLKDKKGIIKKCWSDLHAYSRGSSYSCNVMFDDNLISGMAAWFIPFN